MTIKITKQLATVEDLAIGTGTVVQERNGVNLTLTKIDFITKTELASDPSTGGGALLVNGTVIRATSVAAIEAYSAPVGYVFSLNAGGRSGTFDVIAGDFSTELAADTLNGVYVGLSDNPTATSKVAKRRGIDYVTPQMFGFIESMTAAVQTAVIQKALDLYSNVQLPPSDYTIDASGLQTSLLLNSGQRLVFLPGARFLASNGQSTSYRLVQANLGVSDIVIVAPVIVGDRAVNTQTGEQGHGIYITNCEDVVIYRAHVSNCFGDGFYIGGDIEPKNIKILDAVSNNNRRQGISLTSGINIFVERSEFTNTNGTNPQFGVDIEPNGIASLLQNIVFKDCKTSGNASITGFGLFNVNQTSPVDITFDNCVAEGEFFSVKNCSTGKGVVNYINCRSINSAINGLRLQDTDLVLNFKNFGVINPNQDAVALPTDSGDAILLTEGVRNLSFEGYVASYDDKINRAIRLDSTGGNISNCRFMPNLSGVSEFKKLSNLGGGISKLNMDISEEDREIEYAGNLTNSNIDSLNLYFAIFTNKTVLYNQQHTLALKAGFEGHKLGFRVYTANEIKVIFSSQTLYPGSLSSIASAEIGAELDIEFVDGKWRIVREIGTWTKVV